MFWLENVVMVLTFQFWERILLANILKIEHHYSTSAASQFSMFMVWLENAVKVLNF